MALASGSFILPVSLDERELLPGWLAGIPTPKVAFGPAFPTDLERVAITSEVVSILWRGPCPVPPLATRRSGISFSGQRFSIRDQTGPGR
jgi:hypothetical protein